MPSISRRLGWCNAEFFVLEGFFISLLTSRARAAQDAFREQVEQQSALTEIVAIGADAKSTI